MAYRCLKFDKILVGPRKTCDNCETGDWKTGCEYRVWQDGVLKDGGQRTRGKWMSVDRYASCYELGDDGKYHYRGGLPEGAPILELLSAEEMGSIKADGANYYKLLIEKRIINE